MEKRRGSMALSLFDDVCYAWEAIILQVPICNAQERRLRLLL